MFDFTPLYRSTIGFDRLAEMLDHATSSEVPGYPPYNIERTAENAYRIVMAVAGFGRDEVAIEAKQNTLTVSAKKADKPGDKVEYLHQGIAQRAFERRFQLADHMQVEGASLENGLLHIALKREVPEAMKPRNIAIGGPAKAPKEIESKLAA